MVDVLSASGADENMLVEELMKKIKGFEEELGRLKVYKENIDEMKVTVSWTRACFLLSLNKRVICFYKKDGQISFKLFSFTQVPGY